MRKRQLCILLPHDLFKQLEHHANEQDRSLSQMARIIMNQYFKNYKEANNGKSNRN